MAKCLFKWSECSLWNIECGNVEYTHRSSCYYPLSAVSLAGVSVSGTAMALTKKYQEKLMKVTKLEDIGISTIAMFEMSISKVLSKIDKRDFGMPQALYYELLNNLSNVDKRWKQKTETNSKKVYWKKPMT